MVEMDLQKYFNFDDADLFANRSGIMSSKQMEKAVSNARSAKKTFQVIAIVLFIVAVLPSIILFFAKAPLIFLVIWSVIWIPIWTFIGIKMLQWGKPSKADFTLNHIEGQANIVKDRHYNSSNKRYETDYELHIGGVTFNVDSDLADVMMQGDSYAVYYLEGTKTILSAEKI